jgi:hypothetical protein
MAIAADWSLMNERVSLSGAQLAVDPSLMIPEAVGAVLRNLIGSGTATDRTVDAVAEALAPREASDAWVAHLARLPVPLAQGAERIWRTAHSEILERTGRSLGVPVTLRADDGSLHMAWDGGRHYVDVDLFCDGSIEWFYRDRQTEDLDGAEEACAASPLPRGLVSRLTRVAR